MHEELLADPLLADYREQILAARQPCLIGSICASGYHSYFGGLPRVGPEFVWPEKDGYPLHFIGQLNCHEIGITSVIDGSLLFFYDNRHWGYSVEDIGHAVVYHQPDGNTAQLSESDLPVRQKKVWFGLKTRSVRPKIYQQVGVKFEHSFSYPGLERGLINFADYSEEDYWEFIEAIDYDIQIGGLPRPIQADFMEDDCITAFGIGSREDWVLLLQLYEVGDMMWGDAGALYWFILKDDLLRGYFGRVWMVTQCH